MLTVDFNLMEETLVLLCLLRSAPNLHEIEIKGPKYDEMIWGLGHYFWQVQNHLELPKLQTLKLTGIICLKPMLKFIDFILPKALELKQMEIHIVPGNKKYQSIGKLPVSKELMLHWRASTRAEIIFTGEFLSACTITSTGSGDSSVRINSVCQDWFNELWDKEVKTLEQVNCGGAGQ